MITLGAGIKKSRGFLKDLKRIYHKTPQKSRKQATLRTLKGAIKNIKFIDNSTGQ